MSAYEEWQDGYLEPLAALRSLAMELGEVQDELDTTSKPLQAQVDDIRGKMLEIMRSLDDSVINIRGFGEVTYVPGTEVTKYDKRMIDRLVITLESAGDKFTADLIRSCITKSLKSEYIRIQKEKKR